MERRNRGRPRHPDILTPAEWRVLEELRKGGTNAEIALRLGIGPDAVKYHISNMLGKVGVDDRHALAAWRPGSEGVRQHLRGLLAAPVALATIGRPLTWVAVGLAGAVGAAVLVVVLLIVSRGGGDENAPLPLAPDPTEATTPPATATSATALTPESTPRPTSTPEVVERSVTIWRNINDEQDAWAIIRTGSSTPLRVPLADKGFSVERGYESPYRVGEARWIEVDGRVPVAPEFTPTPEGLTRWDRIRLEWTIGPPEVYVTGDGKTPTVLPTSFSGGAYAVVIPQGVHMRVSATWCFPYASCRGEGWLLATLIMQDRDAHLVIALEHVTLGHCYYSDYDGLNEDDDDHEFLRYVEDDNPWVHEVFDKILNSLVRTEESVYPCW
ncbi:MAG: helix-turn-helix transcriptional regulator [Dehalococcoidia bacterium]|nr:helix-turn-helix transcriptional regulator [Dehalococcoidia bacterium]MYK25789.1 helix-turn-helix transcriptional regulator [Dehalococcoidia bacterium]